MEEPRDANSPDSSGAESPSPSLPSPPILPLQAAQQAHRTTNFFIDNILRPDFGCKKELARERAQSSSRERGGLPVVRPTHPGTPCQDSNCSSDSTSSSSAASSLALSPSPKKSSSSAAEDGSGGGGGGAKFGDTTSSSSVVLNGTGGSTTPTPETQPLLWPAWVYCTRYSDRPSSGKTRVMNNKTRVMNKKTRLYEQPEESLWTTNDKWLCVVVNGINQYMEPRPFLWFSLCVGLLFSGTLILALAIWIIQFFIVETTCIFNF